MKRLKKISAFAWGFLMVLPCVLAFSGLENEELTFWNILGAIWIFLVLRGVLCVLVPKWMRRYLCKFTTE